MPQEPRTLESQVLAEVRSLIRDWYGDDYELLEAIGRLIDKWKKERKPQ